LNSSLVELSNSSQFFATIDIRIVAFAERSLELVELLLRECSAVSASSWRRARAAAARTAARAAAMLLLLSDRGRWQLMVMPMMMMVTM
jgi:hypothetical protein